MNDLRATASHRRERRPCRARAGVAAGLLAPGGAFERLRAFLGGVVPELDRLARSVPDARDIGDTPVQRGVRLSLGGSIYDAAAPMSEMLFNMLAVFAEFEADLLKMRTREGMAIARSRGKLKGRAPKLSVRQQAELVRMHATGEYTIADLMEVFFVGRATVYRTLERA
ncbi:recombinase family protein [Spirillospora sp. NPDC046719]